MRVLPLADPDPVLSPVMVSWLISGLTFVVTVTVVIVMVKVLRNKEKQPSELERETRTCKSASSLLPPPARASKRHLYLIVFVHRCGQHICRLVNQQMTARSKNAEGKHRISQFLVSLKYFVESVCFSLFFVNRWRTQPASLTSLGFHRCSIVTAELRLGWASS